MGDELDTDTQLVCAELAAGLVTSAFDFPESREVPPDLRRELLERQPARDASL